MPGFVPESVLKKRATQKKIAAAKDASDKEATKKAGDKKKEMLKRAETYVNEYAKLENDAIRLRREAKTNGSYYVPGEPDLDTLDKIGKSGTFQIDNFAQLTSEFKKIASYISFLSSNVFVFVYCSPRRGGTSEVELRFDGKDGTKYEVDTKDFDTSDGVCNQVRHSA